MLERLLAAVLVLGGIVVAVSFAAFPGGEEIVDGCPPVCDAPPRDEAKVPDERAHEEDREEAATDVEERRDEDGEDDDHREDDDDDRAKRRDRGKRGKGGGD